MKKFKNFSFILLILSAFFFFNLFFSCSKSDEQSNEESKQKILKLSQKFITFIFENKYKSLYPMMDKKMQKVFTKQQVETLANGIMIKFGKPLNFKFKGGGRFQAYYMALIQVEHEKANLTYQVAFDKNYKISGFYLKKVEDKFAKAHSKLPPYVLKDKFKEIDIKVGKTKLLDGKLTYPVKKKNVAFVLLVHGSGPNDMDETIGPNKIFRDIAYGLSSKGIGVLRYNKITYQYPNTGIDPENYSIYDITINDAIQAYKKIISYKFVDKNNIYILGHSLGGMFAPLIYKKIMEDKTIKFKPKGIIIMGGTVDNLANLILRQMKLQISLNKNISETDKKKLKEIEKKVEQYNNGIFNNDFELIWKGPFWKSIKNYSILNYLQSSNYPVLILQGLKDVQVFPDIARSLEKKLKGKSNITFSYFDNLNHLMIPISGKSTGEEYLNPGFVDEKVIQTIKEFIEQYSSR